AAHPVFACSAAISPNDCAANIGLAECAMSQRDYHAAERFLRTALRTNPGSLPAHKRLGTVMAALGRWREARDEFAICASSLRYAGQAYVDLARAQQHLGDRA